MKNLQELVEKYKKYPNGLGRVSWGGKSFFEINSDTPLSLNSYGGNIGFVLNEKGEVELYDLNEKIVVERHYYLDEDWDVDVDYQTEHFWDETEPLKWWGKTLDNYYPWPWYPEKEIKAFTVMRALPFFDEFEYCEVVDNSYIKSTESHYSRYTVAECLSLPEWFKPIYK